MDLQLKGKKALVTGSSIGIGAAIAKSLAKEGAHVMLHGRRTKELERITKEITTQGGIAHFVAGDLTNEEDVKRIVDETLREFKELHILVNNAGEFPERKWEDTNADTWMNLFDINVISMVRLINAFLPQMKALGWGRIIQIASVAGISPSPNLPEYGATKAANINMTMSLAKALAGTGITVNSVSPGPVATEGVVDLFTEMAKEKNWGTSTWQEIEAKVTDDVLPNLLKRFGSPEEVGNLVAFLASPLAGYITAANIRIDGGRLA